MKTYQEFREQEITWALEYRHSIGENAKIDVSLEGLHNESKYTQLLGNSDLRFLQGYRRINAQKENMLAMLNQDPVVHPEFALGPLACTFIGNNPVMWGDINEPEEPEEGDEQTSQESRWMGARELLLMMGFCALERFSIYGER